MNLTASDISTRLVVGMEIHVELCTRTKMFTAAGNIAHRENFEAAPNSLCDPVVLGMPGVLPVINKLAVEMSMLVGLALNCQIARFTKWDRKSYYYPDLPKNYQISQYDLPLCAEGWLDLPPDHHSSDRKPADDVAATSSAGSDHTSATAQPTPGVKRIRILRAHLEEDAGKLLHEAPGGYAIDHSIVDLNRAGTPLLEIVTEPDFDTPEECVTFAQKLRDICRHLGVTEGIMQRGHMRFEPNINVHITRNSDGQVFKTPIVEIKNLNSFKALFGAVSHEHHRQVEAWLASGEVLKPGSKSTRGWDDNANATFLQREKEEAHDYRYFPDPDLVPVVVDDAWLDEVRGRMPELPEATLARYTGALGLGEREAKQLVDEPGVARLFDQTVKLGVEAKRAAAVLTNNLARRANERGVGVDQLGVTATGIKAVDDLAREGKIGSSGADELYKLLIAAADEGKAVEPLALAKEHGLLQVNDDAALGQWCEQAIAGNAKAAADVKGGKQAAIGSLVGAVMKLSKGQANPKTVGEMLRAKLGG